MSLLGEKSEIVIITKDLKQSEEFWLKLGFTKKAGQDDFFATFADDALLISVFQMDIPPMMGINYFTNDRQPILDKLKENGVETEYAEYEGAGAYHKITTPEGVIISIIQCPTDDIHAPKGISFKNFPEEDYRKPEKFPNPKIGLFGEFSIPTKDLKASIAFWQKLGFIPMSVNEGPYPWAILVDDSNVIGLHQTEDFDTTAIAYFAPDQGERIKRLKEEGLAENTLVVFTSDNGPWMVLRQHGGTAGLLFGAKGTSYEGGMRVPAIFWRPGHIEPAVVTDIGSTLDLFATIGAMAGIPLPDDRVYDGYDLSPVLYGAAESPRKEMIYYHGKRVFGARQGAFKLYFFENNPLGYPEEMEELTSYRLYNLHHDPSERFEIADEHPDVVEAIVEMVEQHKAGVEPVESQLDRRIGGTE